MKLSVLVTTYNALAWLEKVIWGYAAQTHRDFELIIADDGSSPETADRIRALRRLLVLHGARDAELSSGHLFDVERLLVAWSGQGPIDVPGSVEVRRVGGEMIISPRRKGE